MSTKSPKFYRLKNDKNIIYKFFIETMILSDFIATWMFFYAVNEVNINRDSWSFAFNIGQKMALRALYVFIDFVLIYVVKRSECQLSIAFKITDRQPL